MKKIQMASMARDMIGQATRSWVFRRRLSAEFGRASLFVTPSAGLKYLFKATERLDPPLLRNVIELVRENDVVWDVGANIGLFSFAAAAQAGREGHVVAFEPDIWLAQLLRRSCALQSPLSAKVTVIPVAVASDVSLRPFLIARRSRAANALAGYGSGQMGGVSEDQVAPTFNLDWLLAELPAPKVIKCDVEGAETEVFRGQRKILDDIRPVIICEVSSENAAAITGLFREKGYHLYDGERPLAGSKEIGLASWNTVALPSERRQKYLAS
jgi:FkbM family methyltransferase